MLIGIFKSNQKLVNILAILLTAILWIPSIFIDSQVEFLNLISTNFKWLDVIISVTLISFQSIYLNIIVSEYKLVKENSHLTSLMLLMLNSCCLPVLNLNQVVIANTFILIAFHQLLRMYNSKSNYAILFNAAFLIALASLIYMPSIVYFALLWIVLVYTATPKWRDFIISLIGLSIPLVYFIAYKFVFGSLSEIKFSNYSVGIFGFQWSEFTLFLKILFEMFMTISLFAFMALLSTLRKSVVRVKKMLVVVVVMFIIGLATLFLNKFDYLATFLIVSIPLAIIITNFFQNIKKMWIAELLFMSLIGGLILSYFS